MIVKRSIYASIFLCVIYACNTKSTEINTSAISAFDASHSDPAAVQLLDSVVSAGGGQRAWDESRYFTWNADGDREIAWDKQTGKVRVESKKDQLICIFNTDTDEGKVQLNGTSITDSSELSKRLAAAKQQFQRDVNDFFPGFNLRQSGYSFIYLGEETLASGERANIVEVERVTDADHLPPISRLFIDLKNNHILQIGYLNPMAPDSLDIRVLDNYKPYGDLILSADRSNGNGPRDVKIVSSLSDNIFEEL